MERLFPAFNAEEQFVVEALDDAEAVHLADTLRRIVAHLEEHGEERRESLRKEAPVPPRRGGRRRAT